MVLNMLIKQKITGRACHRNDILMVDEILGRDSLIKYKVKWKKTLIQIKTFCLLLEEVITVKKNNKPVSIY